MDKGDIESGNTMYPSMVESPLLRWGFIRKVYGILAVQLAFTAAFSSVFIFFGPAREFAQHSKYRFIVLICTFVFTILLLFPLYKWYKKHPLNYIILGLYTLAVSVTVGFVCALVKGAIILEAALLTAVVVGSLTAYTFWAVKRGHDFTFLWPFLFASVMLLLTFGIIQIFFPLGPLGRMIYSGIGALLMCGFIVYDTNSLIKHYSYDEYIWAAIALYGDLINLFLYLVQFLREVL